jgi:hypothetical protein
MARAADLRTGKSRGDRAVASSTAASRRRLPLPTSALSPATAMNARDLLNELSERAELEFNREGRMAEFIWFMCGADGECIWSAMASDGVPNNIDDGHAIRVLARDIRIELELAQACAFGIAYPATIFVTTPQTVIHRHPLREKVRAVGLEVHTMTDHLVATRTVGLDGRLAPIELVRSELAAWGDLLPQPTKVRGRGA